MAAATCEWPECSRPVRARGLCITCYHRVRHNGDEDSFSRKSPKRDEVLHYLGLLETFTLREASQALDIGVRSARRWVKLLEDEGLLARTGRTRSVPWVLTWKTTYSPSSS